MTLGLQRKPVHLLLVNNLTKSTRQPQQLCPQPSRVMALPLPQVTVLRRSCAPESRGPGTH